MKERLHVGNYALAPELYYDRETHMWVAADSGDDARCGLDPIGAESSGDIVALSFQPVGTRLSRGEAFGSLEAAKFVGPLVLPAAGTITAHNEEVLRNPALLNDSPLDTWMIRVKLDDADRDLELLLHDPDALAAWYAEEIERYKNKGMIAQ